MKKLLRCLLVAALGLLAGCMDITIDLKVNDTGRATQNITIMMKASDLPDGMDYTVENMQYLKEALAHEGNDVRITDISEGKGENARFGFVAENTAPFGSVREEGSTIMLEVSAEQILKRLAESMEFSRSELIEMKKRGMRLILNVQMPFKPTASLGKVEGNTVTIDMLDLPGGVDTIEIRCSRPHILPAVIAAVLGLLFLAGFFMTRKRKV
ncbi:MAG: hypothetical protein IKD69_00735 [Solobacterium sp.]|nr:hypothetical protein [Solobacterium sp.]